ncbi:YdcF family protein [Superficieibacter sp.]|uniref:YdcF family protein n=1 Tax=Superficieibacter sp. TaxID=2303322 RepID=UPI0028AD1D61|nr:YdcF family protein [Superficieibacter sp.]
MTAIFPQLPDITLSAANQLGEWLAQNETVDRDSDLIVLAGNAVIPTIDAACELAAAQSCPLLISGGIGHSTTFLYAAVARHPRYNKVQTTGRSEAGILGEIARDFWNIAPERILLETKSTNCGENARFTRQMLEVTGIPCTKGVVVQDPTMQRRTMATFAHVWQDVATAPRWQSFPGIVARLVNSDDGLTFADKERGMWPPERYLSLILGEIPRLRDDAQGYGPNGKGFITHVNIPAEIERAWQILRDDALLNEALKSRSLL